MKDLCVFLCVLLVAFCVSQTKADLVVLETKDCGSKDAVVKNVTMSPAVPRRGVYIFLTTTILTELQINGGKIKIRIFKRFFGLQRTFLRHEQDLCDNIQSRECPIKANKIFKASSVLVIGRFVRYGDYTFEYKFTDERGKQFACLTFEFPFH